MTEEIKQENKKENIAENTDKRAATAVARSVYGTKKRFGKDRPRGGRDEARDEFDQQIVDLARVTRVMAGGKRMRFRACVAVGDKKGNVGIGLAKGADVAIAVSKAVLKAKKNIVHAPMINETIPHEVYCKFGAAKILLKPARKGRGVIAGGVVRIVLELAGIKNITSKILGTNNKVNNAKCVIEALKMLKKVERREKKQENKVAEKNNSKDNKIENK